MTSLPLGNQKKRFPLHIDQPKLTLGDLEMIGQKVVKTDTENRMEFNKSVRQRKVNQFTADNAPIPLRYKDATLSSKVPTTHDEQYKIAAGYVRDFPSAVKSTGRGLLLWGAVGSGKTHMACAIGNTLLNKGKTVLYVTVDEIIAAIGASKSFANKQNQAEIINRFAIPDLLIIDEIGRKMPSESERNILSSIIHLRESNLRPIVGISNLPPHQLRNAIGDMAMSRLVGHGSEIVKFDQNDMRTRPENDDQLEHPSIPCFDEDDINLNIKDLDASLAEYSKIDFPEPMFSIGKT